MSATTRFTVEFSVEHDDDGCGEAWDTGTLTAAVLVMLGERFENDGLRIHGIEASEATA